MEKRAVIEDGITPPEHTDSKEASASNLENHSTKRLSDEAMKRLEEIKKNAYIDGKCKEPDCPCHKR